MPFQRPKLTEIIERIKADAISRYGADVPRRSLLNVISVTSAAAVHSLYGYIEYVSRQTFATSAEGKHLERRASEYGVYRKQAVKASGFATFSGTGTVPAGTILQTIDELLFETTADSDTTGKAPIRALEAGKKGNINDGSPLSLVSPVIGIESECIASDVSAGADTEGDEELRERLLYRMRNPPKAGTATDYVAWAKEVAGVTRAWCSPLELGPGHVTVRFMTDNTTANGVPTDAVVRAVQKHIEELMPVTTILTVVAPIPKPLNMTVQILPDRPEIRTKVQSAVNQIIKLEVEPSKEVLLTSLDRAVASVSEVTSFRITSPADDVTAAKGEILVPGVITFE